MPCDFAVPVVREQLPHLHRVLDHVQELEDHEQAEAGEECARVRSCSR